MPFNPDDPKYTAYVLGELDDSQRAAIDAELKADPAATAAVADIRAATLRLSAALQAEPLPLTSGATGSASASAGDVGVAVDLRRKPSRRLLSWKTAIGALAALAGCVLIAALLIPATNNARESARRSASMNNLKDPNANGALYANDTSSNQMHQVGVDLMNYEDKRKIPSEPAANTSYERSGPQFNFTSKPLGNSASDRALPANSYAGASGTLATGSGQKQDGLQREQSGPFAYGLTGGASKMSNARDEPHVYSPQGRMTGQPPADGPIAPSAVVGLDPTSGQSAVQFRQGAFGPDPPQGDFAAGQPVQLHVQGPQGGNLQLPAGESEFNTESYAPLVENRFLTAAENPLSTFSIDVDTASYSNIRRFLLQQNQLPPPGAVRIEEMINYFRYEYPQPAGDKPFSVTTEVASCPWAAEHRLVRIGLKGRELEHRPPSNLVFLIDVSGSMEQPNKLPLVQQSLKMLTQQLGENDHVAIVVYAGNSGLVLPSTRGDKHEEIIGAIERLRAGGSTNGAQGIELAYEIACQSILKGGVNRVILATDGDFNVGVTNQDALVRLIQDKAKTGVFLTTLGFGYGNLKDSTMQMLADKGNGNNYYIDDLAEARKVLVEQIGGTLVTIAKDVKLQIEFNPAEVAAYRLIGYEKRILAKEDFNDDTKDAGEIGAGHTVTALYEIVPLSGAANGPPTEKSDAESPKSESSTAEVDPLKYQKPASLSDAAKTGELFTLKLRYKQPDGDKSTLMETPVKDVGTKYGQASADFKFAAAVASFGMILRDSSYKGNATLAAAKELAQEGVGKVGEKSDSPYRAEFVQLVDKANSLKGP